MPQSAWNHRGHCPLECRAEPFTRCLLCSHRLLVLVMQRRQWMHEKTCLGENFLPCTFCISFSE